MAAQKTPSQPIAVLGAGPAGMAVALGLLKAGHQVTIYERYSHARPAGSLLNLWPPPIKALADMGVDIKDIGQPNRTFFRNSKGGIRAEVMLSPEVVEKYGGGFIGLLRPDLYTRMLDALPKGTIQFNKHVTSIGNHNDHVTLRFSDGAVVNTPVLIGADGIDSTVRKHLFGDQPKRPHNLHVLGGFTFADLPQVPHNEVGLSHDATIQATYSSILSKGRTGFQWWILEAWPDQKEGSENLHAYATEKAKGFIHMPEMVASTPKDQMQRWVIRDRVPISTWSKGRITLAGDAAHATSPYAAYGAGMSICDGYFVGQCLHGVNLADTAAVQAALVKYEKKRIPHTTDQVNQAYYLGQLFHHTSWLLQKPRDFLLDWTPFLQKMVGDRNPSEIEKQLEEMGEGILSPKI